MANILNEEDANFGKVKELIGNSLDLHEWTVPKFGEIKAKVKVTKRNGVIKTAYLHVIIDTVNGWKHYREQANGKFLLVGTGRGEAVAL